jgi:hypothetical protein
MFRTVSRVAAAFNLLVALALSAAAPIASADVLTFEDLSGNGVPVPANYGGFSWSSWMQFSNPLDPYTPHSGTRRIYSADNANSIVSATGFVLDGAYFSGFSDATVYFQLYNSSSTLLWTSASLNPTSTPTFLSSGYSGLVEKVVVHSTGPTRFVMDDFTFHTAAIPEPETYVMLLAGLGLLGFAARRRKQKAA